MAVQKAPVLATYIHPGLGAYLSSISFQATAVHNLITFQAVIVNTRHTARVVLMEDSCRRFSAVVLRVECLRMKNY
jgi:hypothetical protein